MTNTLLNTASPDINFYGSAIGRSYTPDTYELEAMAEIMQEKTQWNEGAVFVTRKEQYLMRFVIEQARRYYAGIFINQNDELTGEKKTWVPLTESAVEQVVKSIDLDTKDVLINPGKKSAVNVVPIIRAAVLNLFKKIGFGQLLNDLTRVMARDGTVVVKSFVDIDPVTKKKVIKSEIVNLLNFWIDPAAKDIQEGPVIERTFKSQSQMDAYRSVWENIDSVVYSQSATRITDIFNVSNAGQIPYTEVWERWGLIRKAWVTKDPADHNIWVEGHIIASGIGTPNLIHLIRFNPREDGRKPYEECWYRRLDGRWYGRGIPEMLFDLQEYMNMIVNIRKANNMVLQNGIFLIRKGSGITPDMLSSITAGGGLPVTNINNDIKQLNVQDFRQSSYSDEDRTFLMAERVTGAFDIGRGEVGRASASATATLTQDRNIRDTFVLVQEGIGFFIERLIIKQYIPLLKETMTEDDVIRITGDTEQLAFIDEQILNIRKDEYVKDYINKSGFYPEPQEIQNYLTQHHDYLKSMGKQRFVDYFKNIFDEQVDVEVHVTDEKFNRVVAVQQLRDALVAYSRLPVASKLDTDAILREMFEIMGLQGEYFLAQPQMPNTAIQQANNTDVRQLKDFATGLPNETTAVENANGLPQMGQNVPQPQAQGGNPNGFKYPDFQTRINIAAPLSNLPQ